MPARPTNRHWRATTLIPEIVDDFLTAAQLTWDGAAEPYDRRIAYGSLGPELAYLELLNRKLVRRGLARRDGRELDEFQRAFVCEFQAALATVMASMGRNPDRLIDYVSQGLVEQGIAGVLASVDDGSERSLLFHQQLLLSLKRLLLSTYEGEHATIAVLVVPGAAADHIRWTLVKQDGVTLLRKMKAARALSDGLDSVFAFSASGEFFGLFERQRCMEQLHEVAVVEWQIRHPLTLSLKVDGQRRLELFCGSWRYIDDAAARRILEASDACFSGPTKPLWSLALRLSESRHGGLLLVVPDPAALVTARCCKAEEINLPGAGSRIAEKLREWGLPEDQLVEGLRLEPKEILLEQFLDKSVDQIGQERMARLAAVDGAVIVRTDGTFCAFGVILSVEGDPNLAPTEGARTRAALLASRYGVAIKISADGPITIYKDCKQIFP